MPEQQNLPHSLALNERKKLTLTGVAEVVSFDDASVVVNTPLGTLVVLGQDLQLKTLTGDGGNVVVEGQVTSLSYEDLRPTGGWLSRLFR